MKRPYIDKVTPAAWKSALAYNDAVYEAIQGHGISAAERELIMVRVSQLNGCAYCLEAHTTAAREAGLTSQQLDLLPAWRETNIYDERMKALLAVAEAGTRLPLTEDSLADLAGALQTLGTEAFAAAELLTATINMFNRVSILSGHPVRERKN
ncbi:carboxymuconolactone decarboxylase family protein [Canibacter zhoujuaniae]|uniref:carboxymuconolactone decarboxylase family protein n=1 Tax=Canibacter zhoujuaniae TaxID=2708343 RepID=UPI001AB04264|nr:carboxymuconolactone decarboxylase family protein [Canibacter zhoujuaniae]